jgi:membrane protein DedA with SNARE-associated domain
MLESFLAKYGYIAILLGTAFEGETIMIMGGFSAHRGYLELLPWVVLAGFVGNFIQNMIYFVLGRRYGNQMLEKHPDWKPRLQQVKVKDEWLKWTPKIRLAPASQIQTNAVKWLPGNH